MRCGRRGILGDNQGATSTDVDQSRLRSLRTVARNELDARPILHRLAARRYPSFLRHSQPSFGFWDVIVTGIFGSSLTSLEHDVGTPEKIQSEVDSARSRKAFTVSNTTSPQHGTSQAEGADRQEGSTRRVGAGRRPENGEARSEGGVRKEGVVWGRVWVVWV